MKTSSLEVLEKTLLPPEQARAILQVMESELASHNDLFATKADMIDGFHGLELQIKAQRADFLDGLHRLELKIEAQRADLIGEIKGTVRWNFAFWIAQLAAIAGILKLLK
jgi:hypothetical protein